MTAASADLAANTVDASPEQRAAAREQLALRKQEIEALYARQEAHCTQQFVATPCINQAKTHRRAALAEVKQQELALNRADREQKSAQRDQRLLDKRVRPPLDAEAAARPAQAGSAKPQGSTKTVKAPAGTDPQQRAGQEAQAQTRYADKQREAEQHRAEVLQRQQGKRRAAPLPTQPDQAGPVR